MILMMEQRQCSAFQPLTPVEYPLGINCHEAAPPESHTSRVPPKEQIMKTENVATSRICKCPKQALSVTAATILTYTLHNELKVTLNPVLSSGIVSITSTILLPEKLALAGLCGSFAGMAKTSVVPTVWAAALLGVMCAAILAIFDRMEWFIGYGGRLGFVSQIACTLFFLAIELVSGRLGTDASKAMLADFDFYRDNATEIKSDLPIVVLCTIFGALFMRVWKLWTAKSMLPHRISNSVAAVGMTGILGGFFPIATMGGPAYCGSFVAMTSPAVMPDVASLVFASDVAMTSPAVMPDVASLVFASILAGLSQISLAGLLNEGWGGKLGTAAFMSVGFYKLIVMGIRFIWLTLRKSDRGMHAVQKLRENGEFQAEAQTLPR